MSIQVVAGLGNPGPEYINTRHNVGWIAVDAFVSDAGVEWQRNRKFDADIATVSVADRRVLFVKPLKYMNLSGVVLGKVASFYKVPGRDFAVIYDELQLETGSLKVSVRGGAGGHNGATDVIKHLGPDWVRVRVGVGPKRPQQIAMTDFVLGKFTPEDDQKIAAAVPRFLQAIRSLLTHGPEKTMNTFNQKSIPDERTDSQAPL